jgi:hypothetical protein
MKKISKLTKEQELQLAVFRDKWLEIGLCCEPANRQQAIEGAKLAYAAAGLKEPKIFVWLDSPLSGAYGAAMLKEIESQVESQVWSQVWSQVRSQVESQVWSQVRSQVRSQVESQVWSQVWSQVRSQVESQVWSQVWSQVRSQVWSQVRSQVESQVWSQVWSQVRSQVRSQVYQAGYGSHDASWLGFYEFMQFVGIEEASKLNGLQKIAQSSGWFWPFENLVILTERHNVLMRDAAGRLHCENGPAIAYRDGFKLWRWHGVAIPEEWVSGKPPTAKEALTWPNIEQRRAACEIVGWTKILNELKAKTIDKDDEQIGTLLEVDLPDSGKERFLRVKCGTGREFALPVPKEMKTAIQANAWTYGLNPEELSPEVRT